MFPRASRTLHICLTYRNRLPRSNPSISNIHRFQWRNSLSPRSRCNSSAAVLKEERDGDNGHVGSSQDQPLLDREDTGSRVISDDSSQHDEQSGVDTLTSASDAAYGKLHSDESDEPLRTSTTKFRHWRPPATAAMGTHFLGQPGEILVLQETNRKPRHHKSDSSDEVKAEQENGAPIGIKNEQKRESVYESLKNESRPASDEEAMKNIEEIRKNLPAAQSNDSRGYLARRLLEKSFSKNQMKMYIKHSALNPSKVPNKAATRSEFAAYIVEQIWRLDGPQNGWNVSLSATLKELIRLVKQYHPSKLDLRTVTESQDGLQGTNPLVRDGIEKLVKEDFVSKWVHKPRLLTFQKPPTFEQSVARAWAEFKIEAIAHENMVLLDKRQGKQSPNTWKASAFSKQSMSNFIRQLHLLYQEIELLAQSLRRLGVEERSVLEMLPIISREPTLEGEKHFHLKQVGLLQAPLHEPPTRSSYGSLKDTLLLPSSQFETWKGFDYSAFQDCLATTFFVDFGKATANCFDIGQDDPMIQRTFALSVPYFPQFLASQTQLQIAGDSLEKAANPRISRLTFKPRGSTLVPDLEIYADLSNSNSVYIQHINFQFPQLMKSMSLPDSEIDLRFSRQEKLSLFTKDEPVGDRLGPLIGSIAQQLPFAHEPAHMYDPGNINVNYVMDLDISILKDPNASEGKKDVIRYALEMVHDVQSTVHAVPSIDSALLEHVSYTATFKSLLSESLRRFQTFRMIEKHDVSGLRHGEARSIKSDSALNYIGKDVARFNSFVDDAFKVASRLNEFAVLQSQKLSTRYSKPE